MAHRRSQIRAPRLVELARALSKLGLASRTDARALIRAGRVTVDGRVVTDPAVRVTLNRARFRIDGSAPAAQAPRRVIAFNKPRGAVTTRRDPEGRRTVFDVLGDDAAGLVAVGRLDRASTGLLILTNDSQLANWMTDPATALTRRYVVTVRGRVTPDSARRLETGIDAPNDLERLRASRVTIRKASGRETHLIVELTEGKNREIRRLFAAVGHEVTRLHRIAFGQVELGNLQPGAWRLVTGVELDHLRSSDPQSQIADRRFKESRARAF